MFYKRLNWPVLLVVTLSTPTAYGQYYNDGCSACGPVAAAPIAAACVPLQPIAQTCYQTVPVTTYQREQRTVKVPFYETAYREQEVTVMRPVTTQRTVDVPTVSYQNVTEYRTVNRDMGRWVTNYQPVQKYSPCQVDPRPGFIGWMNRTGYSFRNAFRPNYTRSRQYVPQMMACQVPYTRQVAIRGTRQVTVHDTTMVAEKELRKIPVQKLAYREETVTVMRPQTAYRTVPIGTSLAYGYSGYGYGSTATAYAPVIIDGGATRSALNPQRDSGIDRPQSRSASTFKEDDDADPDRSASEDKEPFQRSSYETPVRQRLQPNPVVPPRMLPHEADSTDSGTDPFAFPPSTKREAPSDSPSSPLVIPAAYRPSPTTRASIETETESKVSSSGWKARRPTSHRNLSGTSLRSERVSLTQKSNN